MNNDFNNESDPEGQLVMLIQNFHDDIIRQLNNFSDVGPRLHTRIRKVVSHLVLNTYASIERADNLLTILDSVETFHLNLMKSLYQIKLNELADRISIKIGHLSLDNRQKGVRLQNVIKTSNRVSHQVNRSLNMKMSRRAFLNGIHQIKGTLSAPVHDSQIDRWFNQIKRLLIPNQNLTVKDKKKLFVKSFHDYNTAYTNLKESSHDGVNSIRYQYRTKVRQIELKIASYSFTHRFNSLVNNRKQTVLSAGTLPQVQLQKFLVDLQRMQRSTIDQIQHASSLVQCSLAEHRGENDVNKLFNEYSQRD